MIELPKQNWQLCEDRARQQHVIWLRSLAPGEALSLYEDLYRLAASQQDDSPGWQRLEGSRWEQKLAHRKRTHAALERLDSIRRERRHTQDVS